MGQANESLYARELSGGFPRLRFEQPLEREFREHFMGQNMPRLRMTLMIGVVYTLLSALLDWQLIPVGLQVPSLSARLAIVSPALLLAVAATYPGVFSRYVGWLVFAAAVAASAGALTIEWFSPSLNEVVGFSTLVATTGFVYLMLGLRLSVALSVTLPLLLGYLLIDLGHELPAQRLGYEFTTLGFINVAGAYACYRLEHAARTSFLEREIVNVLAGSDALTGIPNRRMFNTHLQRVWRQAMRESRGLTVALIEVDYFPAFAARYGQQAADMALRRVAHALMGCARRPLDFSARFSDEEFALVLYDPEPGYVEDLTTRIRDRVAILDIPHDTSPVSERITASIGIAMSPPGSKEDPKALLELADLALTEVKQGGRNAAIVKGTSAASARVVRGPWTTAE